VYKRQPLTVMHWPLTAPFQENSPLATHRV
jgi:hypothetical protein